MIVLAWGAAAWRRGVSWQELAGVGAVPGGWQRTHQVARPHAAVGVLGGAHEAAAVGHDLATVVVVGLDPKLRVLEIRVRSGGPRVDAAVDRGKLRAGAAAAAREVEEGLVGEGLDHVVAPNVDARVDVAPAHLEVERAREEARHPDL